MDKIVFLGTRGEIEPKTKKHKMHTSTLLVHKGVKVMIDCGTTWLGHLKKVKPDFIVLTHAHPDHAQGLEEGAPCPVFATTITWDLIDKYPIEKSLRKIIPLRRKKRIGGIQFEAFPLKHSLRCPAVGYRITCGKTSFFYAPDVAWIEDIKEAFKNIKVYIGDGATITQPMIRKDKTTGEIFGHATVRQQLTWCEKQGVKKMLITHCGSAIVSNHQKAVEKIAKLGAERGVQAQIVTDNLTLNFN